MPYYNYSNFQNACAEINQVYISKKAQNGAREVFNLPTKKAVLDFIHHGGLEELCFQNQKPWEKNPNPETPLQVDAYEFRSFATRGYIAFLQFPNGKWFIKSFKQSKNRNTQMYDAMKQAGLINQETEDEN